MRIFSPPRLALLVALGLSLPLPSCSNKAQLEYQVGQARLELSELQARLETIQRETKSLPAMPAIYANPNMAQVQELKRRLDNVRKEMADMQPQIDAAKAAHEELKREFDAYQARHSNS